MFPILCWLTTLICSQTISSLKDEIRELKQKVQNQDSTISTQTLENQELQEQLDLQRRYKKKKKERDYYLPSSVHAVW